MHTIYSMFLIILFIIISSTIAVESQSLPIQFETDVSTADFTDFDGGLASVVDNPNPQVINNSARVAQIIRSGGQIWGGSKLNLNASLDFSELSTISMKIYTTAPVGTQVKFKLEGDVETERDAYTTISGAWETLNWDFTGAPTGLRDLVFMFDFGNVGDGSESSTFYFDDIEQLFNGLQIDFPVNFEGNGINYATTDFGGNASRLVIDPTDTNNHVIEVVKTTGAATWAGTTIGTPAGFATNIPLALDNSKMTVRVWSPTAGTPIRLKVEDHSDPTHTCETQTNTTLSGQWEQIEFDFNNQATGTELLSIGLQMGWTYNMASIFFDFDTEGGVNGEQTYYFDDVRFGDISSETSIIQENNFSVFPNPSSDFWNIQSESNKAFIVKLYDLKGHELRTYDAAYYSLRIESSTLNRGIYVAKVMIEKRTSYVKLLKI